MPDSATIHINPRILRLLKAIGSETLTRRGICGNMNLRARRSLWDYYMTPAMAEGYIKMIYPEHPNSPDQAYYLTRKGLDLLNELKNEDGE